MYISSQLSAYRTEPNRRRAAVNAGIDAQKTWQSLAIWAEHKARIDRAAKLPPQHALSLVLPILEDAHIGLNFLDHFAAALRGDILANLRCPSVHSERTISIVLHSSGPISISLVLLRQVRQKGRELISLSSGLTALRLINDADASFGLYEKCSEDTGKDKGKENIARRQTGIFSGDNIITIDNARQGLSIDVNGPPALFLRITVNDHQNRLCQRYFDSNSGQLMAQAAGDKQSTRRLMLLSALRGMQADCHLEAMLAATYEPIAALRWQAMRECLATDVLGAMPRLTEMAQCDDDIHVRQLAQQVLTMCAAEAA